MDVYLVTSVTCRPRSDRRGSSIHLTRSSQEISKERPPKEVNIVYKEIEILIPVPFDGP